MVGRVRNWRVSFLCQRPVQKTRPPHHFFRAHKGRIADAYKGVLAPTAPRTAGLDTRETYNNPDSMHR